MKRRDFIQTVVGGAGAIALAELTPYAEAEEQPLNHSKERKMHTLTKLPYAFDALEPFIDAPNHGNTPYETPSVLRR